MMPAMQTVQTGGGLIGPKPYYRISRTGNEMQRCKIYEEEGIERK